MNSLTPANLPHALSSLDRLLVEKLTLLIGGGGAMVLAYGETESTHDLDAVPLQSRLTPDDLRPLVLKVAEELDLPKDWMNPYFSSFTQVLPADFRVRTRTVFQGANLHCLVLGPEDLLVMKLMAGRKKDERHIRRLLKQNGLDLGVVETQLNRLEQQSIKGASEAAERFDDFCDAVGIAR